MDKRIAALRAEIAGLQETLRELTDNEAEKQTSKTFDYKKLFDDEILRQHKAQRSASIPYILNLPIRAHVSGPFVYGMIVPIALLDICLVVFQATCFRLWGVPRIQRHDYVVVDRHHLAYLNGIEKLNCIYCGYANGVFAFARELAARTEQYWCPIKHAMGISQPHSHYGNFIEFGDADAWQNHPSRKKPKS